jgi:hypothetical protein
MSFTAAMTPLIAMLLLVQGRSDIVHIAHHRAPSAVEEQIVGLITAGDLSCAVRHDPAYSRVLLSLSRRHRTVPEYFPSFVPIHDTIRSVPTSGFRTAQQSSADAKEANSRLSTSHSCKLGSKIYSNGQSVSTGAWCQQTGGCPIGQIAHPLMVCQDGRWVAR